MDSASKHYSTRSEISKNGSKSKTTATQSQLVLKPYHQNENDEMEEELEEELEEQNENVEEENEDQDEEHQQQFIILSDYFLRLIKNNIFTDCCLFGSDCIQAFRRTRTIKGSKRNQIQNNDNSKGFKKEKIYS
jgi:hypothetical protein